MGELSQIELNTLKADWPLNTTRYYAVDYDNGSDANAGYSDVDMATAGTVALKTLSELRARMPLNGAGRQLVVAVKARSVGAAYKKKDGVTDDDLDLRGFSGYRYFLARGTDSFANDAADKVRCGAVQAEVGPNGDGSWTVDAGGTTSAFSVKAGALTAEPALIAKRIRFKGNVTAGLANVTVNLYSNTSTQITVGTNLTVAPADGDEFFIEQPGVVVNNVFDTVSAGGGLVGSSGVLGVGSVVGFSCITAYRCNGKTGAPSIISFCEVTTATSNINFTVAVDGASVQIIRSYFDETGTQRFTGVGFRCASNFSWSRSSILIANAFGMMRNTTGTISRNLTYTIGAAGSYFECMPTFSQCGNGAGSAAAVPLSFFGKISASDRRLRINGNINVVNWNETNGAIRSVEFANCASSACIRGAGVGLKVAIDDVVGSIGNTGYGVDVSACQVSEFALGVNAPNTAAGTSGDILAGGSVPLTHASLTQTNVRDERGNHLLGTGGAVVDACFKVTNKEGSALAVGDIVRSNGTSGEVVKARANNSVNASGPLMVMVTPAADNGSGYAAPLSAAWVDHSAVPVVGSISYLDPANAGKATTTLPPVNGTDQKRRLGAVLKASGSLGLVVGGGDLFPSLSDGTEGAVANFAVWDPTLCRYFLVDNDSGDDANVGYIDAAPGSTLDPTGRALKTIQRFHQIFPRIGNGRMAAVMLKARAGGATYKKIDTVTDDRFDFVGTSGYRYLLRRGSTDLTNSSTDRVLCGAIVGAVGPNGDQSWTVTAGATVSAFSVAAGAVPAEPGIIGMRVRFKGNVTLALANVCAFISANTSTEITVGTDLATAPAAGDEFFVERPGVRMLGMKEVDGGQTFVNSGGTFVNVSGVWTAGLCFTGAANRDVLLGCSGSSHYVFLEATGNTSNVVLGTNTVTGAGNSLTISATFVDESGTSRSVGSGLRANTSFAPVSAGAGFSLSRLAMTRSSAIFSVVQATGTMGFGGSYFANGAAVCSFGDNQVSPSFGTTNPSDRKTRIVGGTLRIQGRLNVNSVDFANCPSACITIGNTTADSATPADKQGIFGINNCTGTSGNMGVGIDASLAHGALLVMGRNGPNSLSGATGDIKLFGGAVVPHADVTAAGIEDQAGNRYFGTATGIQARRRLMYAKGADVPSAAKLTLGSTGNVFGVTGSTPVDFITTTGWVPGAMVDLILVGNITLRHNVGGPPADAAPIKLIAGTDLVGATIVPLVYDGTAWLQRSPAVGDGVTVGDSPTWTGLHTFNPGTSPVTALTLDIAALGNAGTRDSHAILLRGRAFDASAHAADWKALVSVTGNDATSSLVLQTRKDTAGFAAAYAFGDDGTFIARDTTLSREGRLSPYYVQGSIFGAGVAVAPAQTWRLAFNDSENRLRLSISGGAYQSVHLLDIRTVTANTTLTDQDQTVLVDTSGGNVTITLPAAAGRKGKVYTVKRTTAGGNSCTIDGNAAETIDGALTRSVAKQHDAVTIQSDNANWQVIGVV